MYVLVIIEFSAMGMQHCCHPLILRLWSDGWKVPTRISSMWSNWMISTDLLQNIMPSKIVSSTKSLSRIMDYAEPVLSSGSMQTGSTRSMHVNSQGYRVFLI